MNIQSFKKLPTLLSLGLVMMAGFAQAQENAQTFKIAIPRFKIPTGVQEESGRAVQQLQATAELRERLADLLTMNIKKMAPQVVLLERRELDEAIKTLKLQEDGLFDSTQNAAKLGKFLKADYIVIGTTTVCGTSSVPADRLGLTETAANEVVLNFSLKLLKVETAEILDVSVWTGAKRYQVQRGRNIERKDPLVALSEAAATITVQAADSVRRHFWTELEAKMISEDTVALKIGQIHKIQPGTRMMIYEEGAEHVIEGEKFRDRTLVGEAEITSVQQKVSIAKLKGGVKLNPRSKKTYIAVRVASK